MNIIMAGIHHGHAAWGLACGRVVECGPMLAFRGGGGGGHGGGDFGAFLLLLLVVGIVVACASGSNTKEGK